MSKIAELTPQGIADAKHPRLEPAETQAVSGPEPLGAASPAQPAALGLTQAIPPKPVSQERLYALQAAVDAVNAYILSTQANFSIRFELDQRSGPMVALIRNVETGAVLKQIPSETLLNIAARVRQAAGIFADLAT
ncbi:MAG: flagellar protein FlaG [SAR324 cluster bacterium]